MWGLQRIAGGVAVLVLAIAPTFADNQAAGRGRSSAAERAPIAPINAQLEIPVNQLADALEVTQAQVISLAAPADAPPVVAFSVALDGVDYTILLQKRSIRAADFRLRVIDDNGTRFETPPPPRTYRGSVRGIPRSRATASVSDQGQVFATIDLGDGRQWMIQPVSYLFDGAALDAHALWRVEDVLPSRGECGVADDAPRPDVPPDPFAERGVTPLICEVGIEADHNFFTANSSSVPAVLFQIEDMMSEVDVIYQRDTMLAWEITEIVVRASAAVNPYTTNDPDLLLIQVENIWDTQPYSSIRHDVAHLFTGRDLDGDIIGKSNIGVICEEGENVSLAQSQFSGNRTQRIVLHTHELGHAWSATHCNGSGDCKIMCGTLNGCGGPGSPPQFGATAAGQITSYKPLAFCVVDPLHPPITPPFFEDFESGTLNPVRWSYWRDAQGPTTGAINEPSGNWSCNLHSESAAEYGADEELRTNYILLGGQSGAQLSYWTQSITVEINEPLQVYYYNNNHTWVLINSVTPVVSNNFAQWSHPLPADALHDQFRVRFQTTGDTRNDDWLIDDVSVTAGPVGLPNITHSFVEVPISAAAITEDPLLAEARCFDVVATLNNGDDWTVTGAVFTISNGVFYKSKFIDPNNPMVPLRTQWTTHPSLQYDTFVTRPTNFGTPLFAGAQMVTPERIELNWFDVITNNPGSYTIARVTVLFGDTLVVTGESGTQLNFATLTPFSYTTPLNIPRLSCPLDFDDNGIYDLPDLAGLLAAFGAVYPHPDWEYLADFNNDGSIDLADLAALLAHFSEFCD